ncbi:YhjD/YihY/BrkB family envelope integrity protein [Streptomyces sp. TP-A0874]|uniref:YhjD/YihY/BrkB family envelope integrity protein n=1 Tax=Streptomyces sp. TP-A0874 TaxID=549819 RepID=UPI0008532305|nr:YhjD/YihY/BrkB family envelope integrity protein [Streptomyces sp. TP-A0874]
MPSKPSDARAGRPPRWKRLSARLRHSAAGRVWAWGTDIELLHRAMGFAALGFLTLVPLLVVVFAADPTNGRGFAQWLGEGLGVSHDSKQEINRLFAPSRQALRTTTSFGLAALCLFGLTFGSAVQTGYEKVWGLPPGRWHARWRHVLWLAVLIAFLVLSADTTLWGASRTETTLRGLVAALSAVLFFWFSQWLLLAGRIGWMTLLPGALATVVGLLGLRVFSNLVFSPLIASNAVTYGSFGTVLAVQSWLVGVGFVVFGGALFGRWLHEEHSSGQLRPPPGPHRPRRSRGR